MKFNVAGMTCSHCERAITRAVAEVGGVARINLEAGTVEVEGSSDIAAVQKAIEAEGYQVTSSTDAASPAGTGGCCAR